MMWTAEKDNSNNKDTRSSLARKNMLVSFITKCVGMLTSFLLVPLTLSFLNPEVYGIWLTISSILFWFTFFDIGLGNGMRNYVAESLSKGEIKLANKYVSTTFMFLFILGIIFTVVVCLIVPLIDFQELYNTTSESKEELLYATLTALLLTIVFFVIKNVGTIYMSLQLPAVNDILLVSGSVFTLIIIYLCSFYINGSLLLVVSAFTIPPVVIFLIAYYPTFKLFPHLKPSRNNIDFNIGKSIIKKGLGFFFIQITSCLVIYGSSNLFVAHYCGTAEVTNYGIAYKFFNLLCVVYTIYLTPYWNAYTDAYTKKDTLWIKNTFYKTLKVWCLFVFFGLLMIVIAPFFYSKWIGDTIEIPYTISISTMIYISMFNLNNCVTFLINGLNKIKVQIITSVVFTLFYIISVTTIGKDYGVIGIIGCMTSAYFLMAVIHLYQCYLFINNKASGIWNQ